MNVQVYLTSIFNSELQVITYPFIKSWYSWTSIILGRSTLTLILLQDLSQ